LAHDEDDLGNLNGRPTTIQKWLLRMFFETMRVDDDEKGTQPSQSVRATTGLGSHDNLSQTGSHG